MKPTVRPIDENKWIAYCEDPYPINVVVFGETEGEAREKFEKSYKSSEALYLALGEKAKIDATSDSEFKDEHIGYCPICDSCGEDGCCPATACQMHPQGTECDSYLSDLREAYRENDIMWKVLDDTIRQTHSRDLQLFKEKLYEQLNITSYKEGGLTFEQAQEIVDDVRKRLSIPIEEVRVRILNKYDRSFYFMVTPSDFISDEALHDCETLKRMQKMYNAASNGETYFEFVLAQQEQSLDNVWWDYYF